MPVRPTDAQQKTYTETGSQAGTPPMVEATHLQEATIAGFAGLGLAAAVMYTSLRARANR